MVRVSIDKVVNNSSCVSRYSNDFYTLFSLRIDLFLDVKPKNIIAVIDDIKSVSNVI